MQSSEHSPRRTPGSGRAWFGFFGGPLAWVVHIGARYPLVPVACDTGWVFILHAVTIVCLSISVTAGVVAWRTCERIETADGPEAAILRRRLFLARSGIFLSALFSFLIVMEALPALMVDPCR